ncbi:DUF2384 domain-containing protein (plasmid) [Rhodococcus antarcticus]|uniref:DUF2384 domain-containing protein n=1 Tax=Rhodococcus antarcticus TaxID=2987751 RepID=A0ABY6P5L6_9NOCA|nr:helix-turn-helix domain-containing protein [Rhodococcus antarcticus]UZJ26969.1 DUF2384 domain-containing protein [Rhodococcus antarcticus]
MPDTAAHREHQAPPGQRAQSLSFLGVLEKIGSAGVTQVEVAKVVGSSARTVQNWASGANSPRGRSADKLLDLHTIIDVLRDTYTPEGMEIWLRSRNRNLDMQRPIELLMDGRTDEVLDQARWVAGGR